MMSIANKSTTSAQPVKTATSKAKKRVIEMANTKSKAKPPVKTKTKASPKPKAQSSASAESGSSSVERVFDVLDLFSEQRPLLRSEDVCELLGYTRSTSYRYIKALADAGLIAAVGGGSYSLGPRAIELERLLHITDPLLHAGQTAMPALLKNSPDSAFLLCTLYGEKVLCIHHEGPSTLMYRDRKVTISRPRGLPFPLFSGAASLIILATLPAYRIKSLFLKHHHDIQKIGLAQSWEEFRTVLADMRRRGYAFTAGGVNPFLGGLSVPIISKDDGAVLGSLTQVQSRDAYTQETMEDMAIALKYASESIVARMETPRVANK